MLCKILLIDTERAKDLNEADVRNLEKLPLY